MKADYLIFMDRSGSMHGRISKAVEALT